MIRKEGFLKINTNKHRQSTVKQICMVQHGVNNTEITYKCIQLIYSIITMCQARSQGRVDYVCQYLHYLHCSDSCP